MYKVVELGEFCFLCKPGSMECDTWGFEHGAHTCSYGTQSVCFPKPLRRQTYFQLGGCRSPVQTGAWVTLKSHILENTKPDLVIAVATFQEVE